VCGLSRIAEGRQTCHQGQHFPRHRHGEAYAAVVLRGAYEECGARGQFHVGPGDVLLHGAFEAHLDRFAYRGAHILNLICADLVPAFSMGRIADVDALVRTAERDPRAAAGQLHEQLRPVEPAAADWPAALARHLRRDPACRLEAWAREHGLAVETVSRGFRKVFGVTPMRFRAEVRTHRAIGLLADGDARLASVAADAGFADQAHMTRAVRAVTGAPPGAWRRSTAFNTPKMTAA
jgi:AraC-like DNA-binding protein